MIDTTRVAVQSVLKFLADITQNASDLPYISATNLIKESSGTTARGARSS